MRTNGAFRQKLKFLKSREILLTKQRKVFDTKSHKLKGRRTILCENQKK